MADVTTVISNNGQWGVGDVNRSGTVTVGDILVALTGQGVPVLPEGQLSTTDNVFGYAGYIFNAEAVPGGGLYLARHRWYDPELGRWLSRDPIGYADGMLLYAYVSGNPMVMVDPLGLSWLGDWGASIANGWDALWNGPSPYHTPAYYDALTQMQHAEQQSLCERGLMTRAQVDSNLNAMVEQNQALQNALTDYHQSIVDAASTALVLVPGAGWIAVGATIGSAAVDVSQGQYTQAALNVVPGAGGEVLVKTGTKLIPALMKGGAGEATEQVGKALDDLQAAGNRASEAIPGTGAARGSQVHKEFAGEAKQMGYPAEVSYLGGREVPYGTQGSIRTDAIAGSVLSPQAVFDLKTGSATLGPARIEQIRGHLPIGFQDIPIFPIFVP